MGSVPRALYSVATTNSCGSVPYAEWRWVGIFLFSVRVRIACLLPERARKALRASSMHLANSPYKYITNFLTSMELEHESTIIKKYIKNTQENLDLNIG
jgi:hypothetical protein